MAARPFWASLSEPARMLDEVGRQRESERQLRSTSVAPKKAATALRRLTIASRAADINGGKPVRCRKLPLPGVLTLVLVLFSRKWGVLTPLVRPPQGLPSRPRASGAFLWVHTTRSYLKYPRGIARVRALGRAARLLESM